LTCGFTYLLAYLLKENELSSRVKL